MAFQRQQCYVGDEKEADVTEGEQTSAQRCGTIQCKCPAQCLCWHGLGCSRSIDPKTHSTDKLLPVCSEKTNVVVRLYMCMKVSSEVCARPIHVCCAPLCKSALADHVSVRDTVCLGLLCCVMSYRQVCAFVCLAMLLVLLIRSRNRCRIRLSTHGNASTQRCSCGH